MNKKQGLILAAGLVIIGLILISIVPVPGPSTQQGIKTIEVKLWKQGSQNPQTMAIAVPNQKTVAQAIGVTPLATKSFSTTVKVDKDAKYNLGLVVKGSYHTNLTTGDYMKKVTYDVTGRTGDNKIMWTENTNKHLKATSLNVNGNKVDFTSPPPDASSFTLRSKHYFTQRDDTYSIVELKGSDLDGATLNGDVIVKTNTKSLSQSFSVSISANYKTSTITITIKSVSTPVF